MRKYPSFLYDAGTEPKERKKLDIEQEGWGTLNAFLGDKEEEFDKKLEGKTKKLEEKTKKLDETDKENRNLKNFWTNFKASSSKIILNLECLIHHQAGKRASTARMPSSSSV